MGFFWGLIGGYFFMMLAGMVVTGSLSGLGVPNQLSVQLGTAVFLGGMLGIPVALGISHWYDKH